MPPASFSDAVTGGANGILIELEVTAGARNPGFPDGFNPWRRRIGIRVAAQAQEGAANREVCQRLAEFFGVPGAAVRITKGPTSSQKTVAVDGVDAVAALARLKEALS